MNKGKMFAERLRRLREEKQIAQKEMAAYLGMPSNTYNGLEMGNRVKMPDADTLNLIADKLDCSIDYLMGRTEELLKSVVGHTKTMDTFGVYGHEIKGDLQRVAYATDCIFSNLLK